MTRSRGTGPSARDGPVPPHAHRRAGHHRAAVQGAAGIGDGDLDQRLVRVLETRIERWRYRWFGRIAVTDEELQLVLPMTGTVVQWFQSDEELVLGLAADADDPPSFQEYALWRVVPGGLLPIWPLWQEEATFERRSPVTEAVIARCVLRFREAAWRRTTWRSSNSSNRITRASTSSSRVGPARRTRRRSMRTSARFAPSATAPCGSAISWVRRAPAASSSPSWPSANPTSQRSSDTFASTHRSPSCTVSCRTVLWFDTSGARSSRAIGSSRPTGPSASTVSCGAVDPRRTPTDCGSKPRNGHSPNAIPAPPASRASWCIPTIVGKAWATRWSKWHSAGSPSDASRRCGDRRSSSKRSR